MSDVPNIPEKVPLFLCKDVICRLCGAFGGGISYIAVKENSDLAKSIQHETDVSIKDSEKLPKTVCRDCIDILDKITKFRVLCTATQVILQKSPTSHAPINKHIEKVKSSQSTSSVKKSQTDGKITTSTAVQKKFVVNRKSKTKTHERELENASSDKNENGMHDEWSDDEIASDDKPKSTENNYCVVYEDYNAFKQIHVDFQDGGTSSIHLTKDNKSEQKPEVQTEDFQVSKSESELSDNLTREATGGTIQEENDEIFPENEEDDKTERHSQQPDQNEDVNSENESDTNSLLENTEEESNSANNSNNGTSYSDPDYKNTAKVETVKNYNTRKTSIQNEDILQKKKIDRVHSQLKINMTEEMQQKLPTKRQNSSRSESDDATTLKKRKVIFKKDTPTLKTKKVPITPAIAPATILKHKQNVTSNVEENTPGKKRKNLQTEQEDLDKEKNIENRPRKQAPNKKRRNSKTTKESKIEEYIKNVRKKSTPPNSRDTVGKNMGDTPVKATTSTKRKNLEQKFEEADTDQPPQTLKRWNTRSSIDKTMTFTPVNSNSSKTGKDLEDKKSEESQTPKRWSSRATVDKNMKFTPVNSAASKAGKDLEDQTFKESQTPKRWSSKASVDKNMKFTPVNSAGSKTGKDLKDQTFKESQTPKRWSSRATVDKNMKFTPVNSTVSQKNLDKIAIIDKGMNYAPVNSTVGKKRKDIEDQTFKESQTPKRWSSRATVDKNMKFTPVNSTVSQKNLDKIAIIDKGKNYSPVNSTADKKGNDFEDQIFKEPQIPKRWSSKASLDKNLKFKPVQSTATEENLLKNPVQLEVPNNSSYSRSKRNVRSRYSLEEIQLRKPVKEATVKKKQGVLDYSRIRQKVQERKKEESKLKEIQQNQSESEINHYLLQPQNAEDSNVSESQEYIDFILQPKYNDKSTDKSHTDQPDSVLNNYETKESDLAAETNETDSSSENSSDKASDLNSENSSDKASDLNSENEESECDSCSENEESDAHVDIDESHLIIINNKTDTLKQNDSVSVRQKTDTANKSITLHSASYTSNEIESDSIKDEKPDIESDPLTIEDLPDNISYVFNGPLSPILIDDDSPITIEMYGPPPLLFSEESLRETPAQVTNQDVPPPLIAKPLHLYPVVKQLSANPKPMVDKKRVTSLTTPLVLSASNNNDTDPLELEPNPNESPLDEMNNFLNRYIQIDAVEDGVNNLIEELTGNELKCKVCSEMFQSPSHAEIHVRKHTGQQTSLKCTICQATFTSCSYLIEHQKLHNDRNLVAFCKVCGKGCKSEAGLSKHMTVHNKNNKSLTTNAIITPIIHCSLCDETFETLRQLKRHQSVHHQHQNPCDLCDVKGISTKAELVKHKKLHIEYKFKCNLCPQGYKTESSLEKHRTIKHRLT